MTLDKHGFAVGDRVGGLGVSAPDTEPADLYRASKLRVLERSAPGFRVGPTWLGRGPDLPSYRRRGHRRLDPQTFEARCTPCKWGCRMAVEIVLDKWDPRYRRHRYETFCYGPLACPSYRAGRLRTVPWKGGPAWEEPAWIDEEETGHRRPND